MKPSAIPKKLLLVVTGLFAIVLVSCAETTKQATPTIAPQQTQATPTKTSWPKPKPTWTARPTPTPTAITGLSSAYHLPDWMGDPNTAILAAFIIDKDSEVPKISFYHAANGEKYDLRIPDDVVGYFWYDNAHFGFLSTDLETIQLIDLKTGRVSKDPLHPETLRLWNQEDKDFLIPNLDLQIFEVVRDSSPENGILLEQVRGGNNKSKSKLYKVDWGIYQDEVVVTDTRTEQIIWEIKPSKRRYGTVAAIWSPINESQLALVRGKYLNDFEMENIQLIIVDVAKNEVLHTYDGDFGGAVWSPDGKMILYQNVESLFSNYGIPFQDAPCLLFVETGLKRCLRSIPRFVPSGFGLGTTGGYSWAADSQSIFYIYLYYPLSENKEGEMTGNVCIYSLKDSHIRCPTENLPVLKGKSVVDYDISPDQNFTYFCYSDATILNDYVGNSQSAVVNMNGEGFFSWISIFQNRGPNMCSAVLWRPLP